MTPREQADSEPNAEVDPMRRRRSILELLHAGPSARSVVASLALANTIWAAGTSQVPDRLPGPVAIWPALFALAAAACVANLLYPGSRTVVALSGGLTVAACATRAISSTVGLIIDGSLGTLGAASAVVAITAWSTIAGLVALAWILLVAPAVGTVNRLQRTP